MNNLIDPALRLRLEYAIFKPLSKRLEAGELDEKTIDHLAEGIREFFEIRRRLECASANVNVTNRVVKVDPEAAGALAGLLRELSDSHTESRKIVSEMQSDLAGLADAQARAAEATSNGGGNPWRKIVAGVSLAEAGGSSNLSQYITLDEARRLALSPEPAGLAGCRDQLREAILAGRRGVSLTVGSMNVDLMFREDETGLGRQIAEADKAARSAGMVLSSVEILASKDGLRMGSAQVTR